MMEAWQQIGGKNEIHTGTVVPRRWYTVQRDRLGSIRCRYSGITSVVYGTGTAVPLQYTVR